MEVLAVPSTPGWEPLLSLSTPLSVAPTALEAKGALAGRLGRRTR